MQAPSADHGGRWCEPECNDGNRLLNLDLSDELEVS